MYDWCDSGLCGDKLTWELLGDVLFIDGEGKMDDYDPGRSLWKPLAWLVRSVEISRGVTGIGAHAFEDFTALTQITLPETVTQIGEGAFPGPAPLPEFKISPRNPRYAWEDGMLIDGYSCRPLWPPERVDALKARFAVREKDCVFRIGTGLCCPESRAYTVRFGSDGTQIGIRTCCGTVIDISCTALKPTLREPNLFLPDYRQDPGLEKTEEVNCFPSLFADRRGCVVNLTEDRLEILFSEAIEQVCRYQTDGRVEYYCDDEYDLVMIRVPDLTEEEYAALQKGCL